MKHVLIVGAGASGLMAAIFAARAGAQVTVLEQNDRPGKKIGATGNGKCNLSNLASPKDAYRGSFPEFAQGALAQFSVSDTIAFFSELGIEVANQNGYLYPRSRQAQSVTDALVMEARHLGVKLKTQEHVTKIEPTAGAEHPAKSDPSAANRKTSFTVHTEGWKYTCDSLIMANGSMASAISGSGSSGYQLAQSLGHSIIQPLPALCALKCKGSSFKGWAGVRTEGRITLEINDKPLIRAKGELQLTEYGISGIPVFQVSRYAVRALYEGNRVSLLVDFFPELDEETFAEFLEKRNRRCPYKNESQQLIGLFPDKLIRVLCRQKNLVHAVKRFPLVIADGMPYAQAQVCSGGVATGEINENTMESRRIPGLYFAGELLDIDGTCGGYNLQWAWSSGAVAGKHSAQ